MLQCWHIVIIFYRHIDWGSNNMIRWKKDKKPLEVICSEAHVWCPLLRHLWQHLHYQYSVSQENKEKLVIYLKSAFKCRTNTEGTICHKKRKKRKWKRNSTYLQNKKATMKKRYSLTRPNWEYIFTLRFKYNFISNQLNSTYSVQCIRMSSTNNYKKSSKSQI